MATHRRKRQPRVKVSSHAHLSDDALMKQAAKRAAQWEKSIEKKRAAEAAR
jgi:hypothetical protein